MSISPLKAIRQHCIACSGGSLKDVTNCVIPDCPLYLNFARVLTPSAKALAKSKILAKRGVEWAL